VADGEIVAMDKFSQFSRRDFLKFSSITALGTMPLAGLTDTLLKTKNPSGPGLQCYIFSKHLQFLDYKNMSEAAREIGFDGIDLTVRPKGHVLPEKVLDDLPKATEAMRSFGLSTALITTKVLDANSVLDRQVLETASKLGYGYYRPGWFKYAKEKEIQESARLYRDKLLSLAALDKELGISGSYQNHSGHYFGSPLWDLEQALAGVPTRQMGCQYDIMHATVEGGKNWQIGFRLIKDHINTLVLKDFKWGRVGGVWKPVPVPAGEGMIDFVSYFALLKKYKISVPVSIHCEYDLGGAEHGKTASVDSQKVFSSLQQDLQFYRDA
jgi:sugar phosphate isomerase/epimerase